MEVGSLGSAVADRMNAAAAAKYLGIGLSTLDKWRSAGQGPRYVRLGMRIFYRRKDLDSYIEAGVVETEQSRRSASA